MIKFVRVYNIGSFKWYETCYKSGRIVSTTEEHLPKTVKAFVESHESKGYYDKIYNRCELIYE